MNGFKRVGLGLLEFIGKLFLVLGYIFGLAIIGFILHLLLSRY